MRIQNHARLDADWERIWSGQRALTLDALCAGFDWFHVACMLPSTGGGCGERRLGRCVQDHGRAGRGGRGGAEWGVERQQRLSQ